MAERVRAHDWSTSPLGPLERWPRSLRSNVDTLLGMQFPSALLWGPEFIVCAYNDAYRPLLGAKPEALGRPFLEVWPEARDAIEPQLRSASRGDARMVQDADFMLARDGEPEAARFDYCFSPVRDEAGAVAGVLNTGFETTDRHRVEQALREREARLDRVLESTTDSVYVLDRDWRFTYLNSRAKKQIGVGRDLIDQNVWEAFPEAVGSRLGAALLEAVEKGRPTRAAQRYEPLDAWFEINVFPSEDGLTVFFRDITEQKQAEERRELLLAELNHRVKNTLAVVQSLATQSFGGEASARGAVAAFHARLQALANAHALLTRESWEKAPFEDLVAHASRTCGAESGRLSVAGPALVLAPQQAVTVSLALHELCTNAIKYGALSNETGTVEVRWRIEERPEPRLRFVWRERGGPPVTPPKRRGFGLRMIELALKTDLDGEVRLEFPPEGFVCIIDAPLRSARPEKR